MTLEDILDENQIPYKAHGEHHHTTSGHLQIDCPFCSSDSHKFRMGVRIGTTACTCWTCGYHNLIEVLATLTGLPGARVRALLPTLGKLRRPAERPATGRLRLPTGHSALFDQHRRYLRGRGFDPDRLEKLWDLRGIGVHHRLGWRILIPIYLHGKVVSWTTRALGTGGAKYLSARPSEEAISHKTLLYGSDFARHAIVIVEGPVDVWRIGPGAVATFGLMYSVAQVRAAAEYPVRAVAFDNEPAAQRAAVRLCELLSAYPGRTELVELEAADPGEASDGEVAELRKRFLE